MSVNGVSGVGALTVDGTQSGSRESALGRDAFLRLLVTQLQHQDPTKPIDDVNFIAQLATFSSLEKLTEIADSVRPLGDLLTTTANSTAGPTTATAPPAATDTVTGGNS